MESSSITITKTIRRCIALLCFLPPAGCHTSNSSAAYQPDNIHRAVTSLPHEVRRVALLPIACDAANADMEDECQAMASILGQELIQTKKFEIIRLPGETLSSRT